MKAYKGFDKDLKCRGYQYEIGKTYETDEAELCKSGFHACEAPLETFDFYSPVDSRYCEVDLDNVSDQRDGNSSKVVAKKLTVGAEIGIPGIVKAHIEYVREKTADCDTLADQASGYAAQIGSSGYAAQIGSSGDDAQIGSSGRYAKIGSSGYAAKIGSSGDDAQIGSSGYAAKIGSSGYAAKIGSSGYAAKIGSSGDDAQIGSSGRYAKIGSSGDDVMVDCTSDHAVVVCAGKRSRVKAALGAWICLTEYGEYDGEGCPCVAMKCGLIDGETLKPDVWYTLQNGEFTEVDNG